MNDLTIAVSVIAFACAAVSEWRLQNACKHIKDLHREIEHSRQYADKLRDELLALLGPAPSPLPEIYTPEQMAARPARRWHEQNKDVEKALKWDDAAKGQQ